MNRSVGPRGPGRNELEQLVRLGEAAYEELFGANLGLAVVVARRHCRRGLELLALIQEGCVGLMNAVARSDYARGLKFSTFAVWWIRQSLTVAVRSKSRLIRLPSDVHAAELRVRRASYQLAAELSRLPTVTEVAEVASMNDNKVRQLQVLGRSPISLYSPLPATPEVTLEQALVDDCATSRLDQVIAQESLRTLMFAFGNLSREERDVLDLRYGIFWPEALSVAVVAKRLQMKRDRVEQLESAALARLRNDLAEVA